MCWKFYPSDRFSSYEEYIEYLKNKGFAVEAPQNMSKKKTNLKKTVSNNYDYFLSASMHLEAYYTEQSNKYRERQKYKKQKICVRSCLSSFECGVVVK